MLTRIFYRPRTGRQSHKSNVLPHGDKLANEGIKPMDTIYDLAQMQWSLHCFRIANQMARCSEQIAPCEVLLEPDMDKRVVGQAFEFWASKTSERGSGRQGKEGHAAVWTTCLKAIVLLEPGCLQAGIDCTSEEAKSEAFLSKDK